MRTDIYTKAVLTVIAVMLTVIACNQYIEPRATAQAQAAPFAGVQYAGSGTFFDTKTGDLWEYDLPKGQVKEHDKWLVVGHEKLTRLGSPGTAELVH
jgi:hypothetical protein